MSYTEVSDNGMGCDFCEAPAVGWTKVRKRNRSLGGYSGVEIYMACPEHLTLGTPVYPST